MQGLVEVLCIDKNTNLGDTLIKLENNIYKIYIYAFLNKEILCETSFRKALQKIKISKVHLNSENQKVRNIFKEYFD